MATMNGQKAPSEETAGDPKTTATNDDIEEDEYIVEAIRSRRRNPKTGITEYLIKWENYPESSNTWEPIEHLKCPDLIFKFKEEEKNKRKKSLAESHSKRSKVTETTPKVSATTANTTTGTSTNIPSKHTKNSIEEIHILEDDSSDTETQSSACENDIDQTKKLVEPIPPKPKGFDRGLQIEQVLGSCADENDKLWFFVKWNGLADIEAVEATEIEEKAPRELCRWYRDRLLWSLSD